MVFISLAYCLLSAVIFKVYDFDGNGRVTFNEMLDILRDLTGQFISERQREVSHLAFIPLSLIILHIQFVHC